MDEAAYMLRAIANGTRLKVLEALSSVDELTVSELVVKVECEQSLLSHHLTDMRAKGILNCRRAGKNCFYSLKKTELTQILDCIKKCTCAN